MLDNVAASLSTLMPRGMKAVYLGGHPDDYRPGIGRLWIEDGKLVWEGWMWRSEGWRQVIDMAKLRAKEKGVRLEIDIANVRTAEALNNDQLRGAPTWGLGAGAGMAGVGIGLGTKRKLPTGGKLTHMLKITMVDEFDDEWVVGFGGEWSGRGGEQVFGRIEHELKTVRSELKRATQMPDK